MPLGIEYMLAKRTASFDRSSRASVMMRIASLSVAIGIVVMLLSLAVIGGFRHEIHSNLRGFAADVVLVDMTTLGRKEGRPIKSNGELVEAISSLRDVRAVSAFATISGMAKSGDNVCGLQLKGVGGDYDLAWWQTKIAEGELPHITDTLRHKEILLSQCTARELGIGVGDRVEMLFADGGNRPRRDRFKVSGLYHTGFEELDRMMALADVRDVQRLASWADDEVSGYDIFLHAEDSVGEVEQAIDNITLEAYDRGNDDMAYVATSSLADRYPIMFDWLKAHDVNAAVIIVIMMTVLLFNMASAMLIMVLDRTGMIGLLKAQGMRNGDVRKIFLWRAALLYAKGALWGNLTGLALVAVQWLWSPVKLDPSGYILSVLPVRVDLWWLVLLNVAILAVTMLTMVVPSFIVARIHPVETLKYKQ